MSRLHHAHEEYLNHLMNGKNCCAAQHGRYCSVGLWLKRRYMVRYWSDYVMRGIGKADRRGRLHAVPDEYRARVRRIVTFLFARRGAR